MLATSWPWVGLGWFRCILECSLRERAEDPEVNTESGKEWVHYVNNSCKPDVQSMGIPYLPEAVVRCILSEFSCPQGPCYQIPKLLPLLRQLSSQLPKKETVRKVSHWGNSGKVCYMQTGREKELKNSDNYCHECWTVLKKKKDLLFTVYTEVHNMKKECHAANFLKTTQAFSCSDPIKIKRTDAT